MQYFKFISISVFFSIIANLFANAQSHGAVNLFDKVKVYGLKSSSPTLFIHYDKTVYCNNEQVWFTGYLINGSSSDIHAYHMLS